MTSQQDQTPALVAAPVVPTIVAAPVVSTPTPPPAVSQPVAAQVEQTVAPEPVPKAGAKKKAAGKRKATQEPAGGGGTEVVPAADAKEQQQIQQKFNQFLRYNSKKSSNETRNTEAKHLAELYAQCSGAVEKKAFIGRWSKQGGSKQNLQIFFQQELKSVQESKSESKVGYMTSGTIAGLENVKREWYEEDSAWEGAIRFLIGTNQAEYPIPADKEPEKAGLDFTTSKYWYTFVEDGERTSLLTMETMRKESSSASGLQFEEVQQDPTALDKEKAAGLRLLKMARRGVHLVIQTLSKVRTEILLAKRDKALKPKLDRLEQRAATIAEKVDDDASPEIERQQLDAIQEELNKLHND
eukprot:6467556-Amphidinium_carterae.1